jgi:nitrate/TMAO reductase-like tetraheme cytochrome c subunit
VTNNRPVVTLLAGSRISMLGVALATTAGFSWLFVLPMHLQGQATNPYIGLLVVFAIPALLLFGLALIPIGIARARHRAVVPSVADNRAAWKKLGVFFGLMSFVNVVIGSQATYRAVKYMETENFCGASCHVMKPEFTAFHHAPHSRLECVQCHVEPGTEGYIRAKMSGTRQLIHTVLNDFPRPIESGLESNRLVRSSETCENCHTRNRDIGNPVRILTKFTSDEANTRTKTVLTIMGVHAAHLGAGVKFRYAAADAKRQTIPWVEMTDKNGKITTYQSPGISEAALAKLPKFDMQCVDCHNRPAHSFELPEHALDHALAQGRLPAGLPYLKKKSLEILTGSKDASSIADQLSRFYAASYPAVSAARHTDIDAAGAELQAIFNRNVFPDLKVTWGTYPNNLGHMDSPGCFRCHDGDHIAANKQAIANDCNTCHQSPAVDEPSPEILRQLGIPGS